MYVTVQYFVSVCTNQLRSCSPWGQYGGIIPSVSRSTGSTPWRWVCAIVTMCVCKWIGFCIIFSYSVCACNMYYKHREYWLTCAPSYTRSCPLKCFHSLKNLCIDISFLEFLLSGVHAMSMSFSSLGLVQLEVMEFAPPGGLCRHSFEHNGS